MEQKQTNYLSDAELEAMIAQVETDHMMQAPPQLKENILQVMRQEESKIVKSNAIVMEQKKRMELIFYSVKVGLAATAAMFFLLCLPSERIQFEAVNQSQAIVTNCLQETSEHICENLHKFSGRVFDGKLRGRF